MARYTCVRCGVECHTTEGEHLCRDVAARLKRRERQAGAVRAILAGHLTDADEIERLSQAIVATLANLNVTDD